MDVASLVHHDSRLVGGSVGPEDAVSALAAPSHSPTADLGGDGSEGVKPRRSISTVACVPCRRGKLRCDIAAQLATGEQDAMCTRCRRLEKTCEIVHPQRGRRLGSKNKAKESDPRVSGTSASPARPVTSSSREGPLVDLFHPAVVSTSSTSRPIPTRTEASPPIRSDGGPHAGAGLGTQSALALLADASHIATLSSAGGLLDSPVPVVLQLPPISNPLNLTVDREILQAGLRALAVPPAFDVAQFFAVQPDDYLSAAQGRDRRDVGPELDPVTLGLVDEADLPRLFSAFLIDLHTCAPNLDPSLHTPDFVRAHSCLLLTAIILLGAQSLPGEALLTRRLRVHAAFLQKEIVVRKYRSVEIVQALQCLSLWPTSGHSAEEDQSGLNLAYATGMTLELGLDRMPDLPSDAGLDAQRTRRNEERTLLSVLIWSFAWGMATGRSSILSTDFIARLPDGWADHPLAVATDLFLVTLARLRYEMSQIHQIVRREELDGTALAALPARLIQLVERSFGAWHGRFHKGREHGRFTAGQEANLLFGYHAGRTWCLALAISYADSAPDGVGSQLMSLCRESSLRACEVVVERGHSMIALPVNSSIMVIYSALLALKLHEAHVPADQLPSLLGLLAQVARVLERTGSTPAHRAGPNAILGSHLFRIIQAAAVNSVATPAAATCPTPTAVEAWPPLDWLTSAWPADVMDALSFLDPLR